MSASPTAPEPMTRTYRFAMTATAPVIRTWGRLEVRGLEVMPTSGPVVLIGNHDSHWDPVAIGVAAKPRRQIRALAKASLWDNRLLAPILNGMGQVPIQRGAGDADALATAIERLRAGSCIGVFPEGTISRGKTLRARSGVGRLALEVPEATLICAAVTGTVDIVRVPKRPRIAVELFLPESGQIDPGEEPGALSARCLAEIRARAPIAVGGRRRTEAKWRAAAAEEAPPPR
jgi:1-acyl-sn-glycerol-3-phosphate acyltransferase